MQGFQIFVETLPPSNSSLTKSSQYKLTVGSKKVPVLIDDQLCVIAKQKDVKSKFRIRETCMLVPIYTESTVTQISLYQEYSILYIDGKCEDIGRLYAKLCRVLTHRGFNEFYKPIKRLGRGNFATVYLIEHKYTKIRRAAKVFSKVGQGMEFMGNQALENQIQTLKQIDHPNLVKFDGLYKTESLVYLVTEFLSGGTLEDALQRKIMHTGQLIQKILKDLLSGLAYLDQKQIMHRDIKPENVILRQEDNKWVIGDFGLAAYSNKDYFYDKCGTMGYMAPEIWNLNENQKYRQSCDVYSLGIIAYQLIIGQLPFKVEAENFFDKKIVWVLFDREECQKVHPSVLAFLKQLLDKDPKTRITPKSALQSPFFTDEKVVSQLYAFHEKKLSDRYERILKMANIN